MGMEIRSGGKRLVVCDRLIVTLRAAAVRGGGKLDLSEGVLSAKQAMAAVRAINKGWAVVELDPVEAPFWHGQKTYTGPALTRENEVSKRVLLEILGAAKGTVSFRRVAEPH